MRNTKKYLSVFAMLARGSIFRVLAVLVLMAAGQYGQFMHRLNNELLLYASDGGQSHVFSRIEELINISTVEMTFAAAFLLICVFLCLPGCGYSARCGYTLRRLNISERAVFVLQVICNAAVFVLLWAAETAVCLLLCRIYVSSVPPSLVSHQTMAIAFYRSPFLHSLLPLADIAVWIRNFVMIAVLSLAAASFPYKQRHGKFAADIVSYALLCIVFFKSTVGDGFSAFVLIFCGLFIAAEVIYNVWMKEDEDGDEIKKEANVREQYPYPR